MIFIVGYSIDGSKSIMVFASAFPAFMGGVVASASIFGGIAYSISRKLMGFVTLAEGIFEGFGWRNVKSIDLPAVTKKSKKPGDPAALGVLYFRYSDEQVG
jgi:hypothetical protein